MQGRQALWTSGARVPRGTRLPAPEPGPRPALSLPIRTCTRFISSPAATTPRPDSSTGTRTWPRILAAGSGDAPRGQRASSQRTPRSLPPWKRSSRLSRVTTMARPGQPPQGVHVGRGASLGGGPYHPSAKPGANKWGTKAATQPGASHAMHPRGPGSPPPGAAVSAAASPGWPPTQTLPVPPGATLMAASCPAHAGRGCTREPGHVRPAWLRACRTSPPGSSEPLRPVTPSRSRGCTHGHSTLVSGAHGHSKRRHPEKNMGLLSRRTETRKGLPGPRLVLTWADQPRPRPQGEGVLTCRE